MVPGFTLKPRNMKLRGPDGTITNTYDYNDIQQKLDAGWQVMEGENVISGRMPGGTDAVENFPGEGVGKLTLRNEAGEVQEIDASEKDTITGLLDTGWSAINEQGNPYTITGTGADRTFTDPDRPDAGPMRFSQILGGSYTPGTGNERVRKFQGGWLIDNKPINTYVSGLIDPAQRQALIDAGVWDTKWDDPNDPSYISQAPLNDPRHSWVTPGKMWNPDTKAFDDYSANTGIPPTDSGTLIEPWLKKFEGPAQYKAKTFDKPFQFNYEDLANDPGFKFRMDRALKAVERPAAAGGRLLSGRTLSELTDRASGFASDEFSAAHGRKFGEYLTEQGIFDKNEQTKVGNSDTEYKRKLGEFGLDYDIFKNNQTDIFNKLNVMSGGGSVASGSLGSLMRGFSGDMSSLFNDAAGASAGGVAGRSNSNQSMLNNIQQIALYKSLGIL